MYFAYSILLSLGFILMSPLFLLRREKYGSGFRQRLGNYPEFKHDARKVIWLHCVSVGETNAARPLVDKLVEVFPDHRLIISTVTETGQELASKIFADKADAIFYFPFDWKFTARRALAHFKPSLVLLMETEIWPRFIHEAKQSGLKVAIVNGRLSDKSFRRYSKARSFIRRVLEEVDHALMQDHKDAERITELGLDAGAISVTGNIKFDQTRNSSDESITAEFRKRFGLNESGKTVVIAASTHPGEEQLVLDALELMGGEVRLIVAPRHPERFDEVYELIERNYSVARRSNPPSDSDRKCWAILLDSIGELRAAYEIADIAVVGGSFVPHGGQNVLEAAVAGKAII